MTESGKPEEFGVTSSLFLEWRSPRFGTSNPTRMDNKVWEWMIKSKIGGYNATEIMKGPSPFDEGPTWCFDRFGQTSTTLPDGRVVLIGGEHEDYYDPDFFIYNDVVVFNPDGSIEIYGYPEETFPPTDFHTATLVDSTIIIIGSLSYFNNRLIGQTQVYQLNLDNFAINTVNTYGHCPGWINEHKALLADDQQSINIEKGMIYLGKDLPYTENIDDWRLNLTTWQWERLTDKKWGRWEIKRIDNKRIYVNDIRQVLWYSKVNWNKEYQENIQELTQNLGKEPRLDLFESLYSPNITHTKMPENEDEFRVYRININDVIVRYVEESHSIQVTVEGNLSDPTIEILKTDLLNKLSVLENTECYIQTISQEIK